MNWKGVAVAIIAFAAPNVGLTARALAQAQSGQQPGGEHHGAGEMRGGGMQGGGMHGGMMGGGTMSCGQMMGAADVRVENTQSGAVIRLTARNKDQVQQVQHMAQMMGDCMGAGAGGGQAGPRQ